LDCRSQCTSLVDAGMGSNTIRSILADIPQAAHAIISNFELYIHVKGYDGFAK